MPANKLVVITRSNRGNEEWQDYLREKGIKVYSFPTIETLPVVPSPELTKKLKDLKNFDWLVFTSAQGVHHLKDLINKLQVDLPFTVLPLVAVVGKETAKAAGNIGFKVTFQPSEANSTTLGNELEPVAGKKILLLRTTIGSDDLANRLTARGALVSNLAIYQTRLLSGPDPKFNKLLQAERVSCIVFASPSAVKGFCRRLKANNIRLAEKIPVIAIGLTVAQVLRKAGFVSVFTAKESNIESVVDTLKKLE